MESTYGQIVTTSVASQIADQLQQAIMDGRLKGTNAFLRRKSWRRVSAYPGQPCVKR